MDESVTPQTQVISCPTCHASATTDDAFCNNCGYPFHGTEQEQRIFNSKRDLKGMDLDEAYRKIKRCANTLFFIGGATLLFGFVLYATDKDPETKNALLITNA